MLLPAKVDALAESLRIAVLSLTAVRSLLVVPHLLLLRLLLLVLLQLILSKAAKDSTSECAQKAVARLVSSETTGQTTGDGTANSALAIRSLLAFLTVLLLLIFAVWPGGSMSEKKA